LSYFSIFLLIQKAQKLVNHTSLFSRFAKWTSSAAGHPITFTSAVSIILLWALTGSFFNFSDTWQLVINTGTTIVTFLVVFLVQNTQNRDSAAIQLKLDELIRAMNGAHNSFLDIENMTEQHIRQIKERFEKLAQNAREDLKGGLKDIGTPEVDVD
jgi:low affinity Fe/Cu permease